MMAGGWEHSLALTRCGRVFCLGGIDKDRLALSACSVLGASTAEVAGVEGSGSERCLLPTEIPHESFEKKRVEVIASGWNHCMAITDDGSLFTWGKGCRGQLGHGDLGEIKGTPLAESGTPFTKN